MKEIKTIDFMAFFPSEDLNLKNIEINKNGIIIKLKSKTNSCECPKCHKITQQYHGTYVRSVQDLPIMG